MKYKKFQEICLSTLGMGNMRLPVLGSDPGGAIDYSKGKKMIDYCMAQGINYYDTAYIYHGGESEVFLGRALRDYPRESYYVADKYKLSALPDYKAQFANQLERLGLDRIDFYLLHGISDHSAANYLTNGCIEYFLELKRLGKISYLGFSFHGSPETLAKVASHHKWDFAQIQLNYYDWYHGSAREEYEILVEREIPIMVMEPVHGGLLANLPGEGNQILNKLDPARSVASWALRWVNSLPGVQVVLSGMGSMEQLSDNIGTFAQGESLDETENKTIRAVAKLVHESVAVPCTACRYCVDDCPRQLNIPDLLAAFNDAKIGGAWRLARLNSLPENKRPGACVGCGICVSHCPQSIVIPTYMKEMAESI